MGNIISFLTLISLAIYGYAKSTQIKKLQSSIKEPPQQTPKYIPSAPICPDQTSEQGAKCWYDQEKDSWSCRYVDKNGVLRDANPKCCTNPTCEEIEEKAKRYLSIDSNSNNNLDAKKEALSSLSPNEKYYCFNKYKAICYPKEKDLNKYSNNFCPVNTASNISSPMYNTYEECYQKNLFYKDLSKKECLKNDYYGWCVDSEGKGQCLPGTGDGPNWSGKYNCQASNIGNNSWTYGHSNPYIHVPKEAWKA